MHLQTRSIAASKFARSWPLSASPNSLDYGLQVRLQTRSITIPECISKFTRSWPPSVSPNTLDYHLQVHLQTHSITASKCISILARSRSWGTSVVHSITASQCVFKYARSCPRSVSLSSLDHHFQAHLEFLSSTAGSQSRYTVCRWVAI